jgi:hypothetical protein
VKISGDKWLIFPHLGLLGKMSSASFGCKKHAKPTSYRLRIITLESGMEFALLSCGVKPKCPLAD